MWKAESSNVLLYHALLKESRQENDLEDGAQLCWRRALFFLLKSNLCLWYWIIIIIIFYGGKRGVILICIVNGSGEFWDYFFHVYLKGLAMGCTWGKSA